MAKRISSYFWKGVMHIILLLQWHISPVSAWLHRSSGQWVCKVPSGNLIGDGLSHWWAWHWTRILNKTKTKTFKSVLDNIPILKHFFKRRQREIRSCLCYMTVAKNQQFRVFKYSRYDLVTDRPTDKSFLGLV